MASHIQKESSEKKSSQERSSQGEVEAKSVAVLPDNRPSAIVQRRLQETINESPQVVQMKTVQQLADQSKRVKKGKETQHLIDNSAKQATQRKRLESLVEKEQKKEQTIKGSSEQGVIQGVFKVRGGKDYTTKKDVTDNQSYIKSKGASNEEVEELAEMAAEADDHGTKSWAELIEMARERLDPSEEYLHDDYMAVEPTTTTGQQATTHWGSVTHTYKTQRQNPFITSDKKNYQNKDLGKDYSNYIHGLRNDQDLASTDKPGFNGSDSSHDVDIAKDLLNHTSTFINNPLQERSAAMLEATVYIAERWRKEGAQKIFRAFLRAVIAKDATLDQVEKYFRFAESATDGQQQLALWRAYYINHGQMTAPTGHYEEDIDVDYTYTLDADNTMLIRHASPPREENYYSDEDSANRKSTIKKDRNQSKWAQKNL